MKRQILLMGLFVSFITTLCAQTNCTKWLSTPSYVSAVNIGQVNVLGTKLTVEAMIYQTGINSGLGVGDIVSKHSDPTDDNYLLRSDYCSITTSAGFYQTPTICGIKNNQVYHVAMVYDGVELRFYRNGFLMSKIPATGSLIQNNLATRIGYYAYQFHNSQFLGYINEVRIWNIARTQSQIQQYMNTSLPTPTTQSGLLAYYVFDNLTNKQGNTSFNGTINGSAGINATVPNCNFVYDSCGIIKNPNCSETCYWNISGNNVSTGSNVFGSLNNSNIIFKTNNIDRGTFTTTGRFGWNTTAPTAAFHNVGTVRLQNLPSGVGFPLVVDGNGNVMVSNSAAKNINNDLANEINELRKQLQDLSRELESLKKGNPTASKDMNNAILFQNTPNPVNNSNSTIKYYLPNNIQYATINLIDIQGSIIRTYPINNKTQSITITNSGLASGTYVYSLVINGQIIDSKKMVITN